ncbi:MAG TPA: serine O-acetyltransferase [Chloroflexota bacterium]|nr:serine O-acetyltransferase [Chloroflexota bacterium]
MRRLLQNIRRDIRAARERDPAAISDLEVILAYPGFHARQLHRLAHALQRRGLPIVPRLISHLNRALTGIEIHPAARIGEGLFIDHGMGLVIGETAEIGDDVTLYQGVTLGGTSRLRHKRHPTLRDGVVVGAHAQLIGAIEVGEGARVGAGSVVVNSVPPYSTVVGVPGRTVAVRFPDNRPIARLPDPEAETIELLQQRIRELEGRLAGLERHLGRMRADRMERSESWVTGELA